MRQKAQHKQSKSYPKFYIGELVGSTFPTFENKIGIIVDIQYFDRNVLEAYMYEILNEDGVTYLLESWIYKI